MKWVGWGTSVLLVAGWVGGQTAACSSNTVGLNDGGSADGAGSSSGSTSDSAPLEGAASGSGSGSGSSSGSPPVVSADASPDDQCHMLTRSGQCATCCQQNHSGGAGTYDGEINTCGCTASACQTQCADSFCSVQHISPQPTSPCGTCLNAATTGMGACVSQLNAKCQTDPDCVAFLSCSAGCP